MTIDEAISTLTPADVRWLLRNGNAFGRGHNSFEAMALDAELHRMWPEARAYRTLAASDEALLWQACRSTEDLERQFRDGSFKAMKELRRRGLELPGNCEAHGAWV